MGELKIQGRIRQSNFFYINNEIVKFTKTFGELTRLAFSRTPGKTLEKKKKKSKSESVIVVVVEIVGNDSSKNKN